MTCPRYRRQNVLIQVMTRTMVKRNHHGALRWFCIGWYRIPIKRLSFMLPALIWKLFVPKKTMVKQTQYSPAVFQNCGNRWKI